MKTFKIIVFVVLGCYGCFSGTKKRTDKDVHILEINSQNIASEKDISAFLGPDLEIIPLETREECLVTADGQKLLTSEYLFLADRISHKLFLFDRKGRFIREIGKRGRGPGEYVNLGRFCFANDSLFVQDAVQDKIIVYAVKGQGFREIVLRPAVYYSDFLVKDSVIYLLTNYSNDYQVVSMGMGGGVRRYYLPYDREVEKQRSYWGLNRYIGQNGENVLMIFSHNDTVYHLSQGEIVPRYVFNFPYDRIPAEHLTKRGTDILFKALKEGYIYGVDEIYHAPGHIIGDFGKGDRSYRFVYDKNSGEVVVAESLILGDYGKLGVVNMDMTLQGELYFAYDALLLMKVWEYVVSGNRFENQQVKEKFEKVIKHLHEDDNPVVFVSHFK